MSTYAITVTEATFDGSTSTFIPGTTQFTPDQTFRQAGVLAVVPPIARDNAAGNGVNILDVGLYVGNPLVAVPSAGSLSWASNNAVHMEFLHANEAQRSAIDDASKATTQIHARFP